MRKWRVTVLCVCLMATGATFIPRADAALTNCGDASGYNAYIYFTLNRPVFTPQGVAATINAKSNAFCSSVQTSANYIKNQVSIHGPSQSWAYAGYVRGYGGPRYAFAEWYNGSSDYGGARGPDVATGVNHQYWVQDCGYLCTRMNYDSLVMSHRGWDIISVTANVQTWSNYYGTDTGGTATSPMVWSKLQEQRSDLGWQQLRQTEYARSQFGRPKMTYPQYKSSLGVYVHTWTA